MTLPLDNNIKEINRGEIHLVNTRHNHDTGHMYIDINLIIWT